MTGSVKSSRALWAPRSLGDGSTDVEVAAVEQTVGTPVAMTEGAMLLSVAEAAKTLGVSRGSLYELVNRGEIQSLHIGRRRLVPRQALAEFIEGNVRTN